MTFTGRGVSVGFIGTLELFRILFGDLGEMGGGVLLFLILSSGHFLFGQSGGTESCRLRAAEGRSCSFVVQNLSGPGVRLEVDLENGNCGIKPSLARKGTGSKEFLRDFSRFELLRNTIGLTRLCGGGALFSRGGCGMGRAAQSLSIATALTGSNLSVPSGTNSLVPGLSSCTNPNESIRSADVVRALPQLSELVRLLNR